MKKTNHSEKSIKKPKRNVKTNPIRKKNEREALKGYSCRCCRDFYDALGLTEKQRQNLIQLSSRHRFATKPDPNSNNNFWNLNFKN